MRAEFWKTCLTRLRKEDEGNVTLILGLVAVPLISLAGLAIDMGRITEARSSLQQVADGAALAAAVAKGSDAKRRQIGEAFVANNLPNLYGVTATPTVEVDGENVSVDIDAVVEGTLLALAFPSAGAKVDADTAEDSGPALPAVAFGLQAAAMAEEGESGTRCLIALNPSMANAIYIRGTGDFIADDCEVHANSSNASAIHLQGNAEATADAFTTVGGWKQTGGAGWYSETPEGGKSLVTDPYTLTVADPGGSAASANIKKQNGNVTLSALKYSNITIGAQGTATFSPGVHYITGTISLGSQATLNGTNVTLVLLGNNAKIDMNSGATLKLQAPTGGTYPGFAIVGNPNATTVQTNTVQGGAGSYIRGIWYTPKHKLYVTGNGDFNASSTYSPMIVDNIEIGGNGFFKIGMDHTDYGYSKPAQMDYKTTGKARLLN
jgi:hypothetical protein